ncbi:MAG TPA: SAM-dependent methyltransferase [Thermoleophilaceae bacterium]
MVTDRSSGLTKSSKTAEITCGQRAGESMLPPARRLFHDPYAREFLQAPHYRLLVSSRLVARMALRYLETFYGGLHAMNILRYRFSEEYLERALDEGCGQVVLLGAGYDSLAFRRDLRGATLFELDAPPTQQAKLRLIRERGMRSRNEVVYVPCDFELETAGARLAEHGFDATRPCFVVWYGVSVYLSQPAVRGALADVGSFCAPGSTLVWDYIDAAIVDGTTRQRGHRRAAKSVARRGEPYIFGLTREGAGALAKETGFDVVEHLRTPELGRRYSGPRGPWCNTADCGGVVAVAANGRAVSAARSA